MYKQTTVLKLWVILNEDASCNNLVKRGVRSYVIYSTQLNINKISYFGTVKKAGQ
jgi:hypothetical protein